jgi:hypothetical protein
MEDVEEMVWQGRTSTPMIAYAATAYLQERCTNGFVTSHPQE